MTSATETALTDDPPRNTSASPASSISDIKTERTHKVKVFYTFQGTDTTCLCSFTLSGDYSNDEYVNVPLKECLVAMCASCPDMLLYPDADCAVYSAHFQESERLVWEGHGLLSWMLDADSKPGTILGKVRGDHIEVTLQLHPTHRITKSDYYNTLVHRRGPPTAAPSSPLPHPSPPDIRRVISLPSMQTSYHSAPLHAPAPAPPPHAPHAAPPLNASPPAIHPHTNRFYHDEDPARVLPPIARHLSPTEESASSAASFPPDDDSQASKKRKRSPSLSLPPPSALLDLRGPYEDAMQQQQQQQQQQHQQQQQQQQQQRSVASSSSSAVPSSAAAGTAQAARIPTQHTAIGRRKKRDTKPPNVNDIRTFVQVEKDEHGNYRLPVEIDSWTVLNLGYVVYDRPAFHNQRYIYPVGYKVKKWYRSMVDPRSDTQYTCEILDGGQEPIFRLEADDNPGEVYMGPTPTTVWTIAVRRAFAIRNMDYGHNPVGPDFFGLRKNTIAKMIQDLPNADRCKNYIWQTFKIGTTGRTARGKIFRPEDVAEGSSSASSSTRRPS